MTKNREEGEDRREKRGELEGRSDRRQRVATRDTMDGVSIGKQKGDKVEVRVEER